MIDLDLPYPAPPGERVIYHRQSARWAWDPTHVRLWRAKGQEPGDSVGFDELEKVRPLRVFNAHLFDWLVQNPQKIPPAWDGLYVCCWGTLFQDIRSKLRLVRYLLMQGGVVRDGQCWAGHHFGHDHPIVIQV